MKIAAPLLTLLAPASLLLAACGPAEPESAANRFARTEREIAGRQNALNAQVENELARTEQRLESEAEEALNSLNAAAATEPEEAPAGAAAGNKQR